jgi:spore coat protein U-like protein
MPGGGTVMRRMLALALLCIAFPRSAIAAITSCDFSPTGVAFGNFSGTLLTSTGTITFTCFGNGNANYTLALSAGRSGTYSARTMTFGSNFLSYNLYQDAAYTKVWGDGTGGSFAFSGQIKFKGEPFITTNLTVYGRVPAQSVPSSGTYADTITVILTY